MAENKKKKKNVQSETKKTGKGKLAMRIGAALLLLAVVAGIIIPMYQPESPIIKRKDVMTVNGHVVSSDEFEYFLSNEILDYAYYYGGDYFADKNNFAGILDYVTQEITFYYAFLDWAAENGYTVTEEIEETVRSTMEENKAEFDSPEQYEDYLKSIYATEDIIFKTECMFQCLNGYYDHLLDPENGPYAESAASLADDPGLFNIYGAKHILILTEERSDEEAKAIAEDILKQLEEGGDFDELINEYSEDTGLEYYPDGYTFQEGEFVDEFYNATKELEIGQTSGLVKTDYGYHIIRRIEPDRDEAVSMIIEKLYGTEVDSYVAAAKVEKSKGFDKISYSDFRISVDYPPNASGGSGSEEEGSTEGGEG